MAETHAETVSFVRETMLPEKAPPATSVGAVGWARANLFSGWFNSLLTVVSLVAIGYVLMQVIPWVFAPTWNGASLNECREILAADGRLGHGGGGCWGVIRDRWLQLMFGFYPADLYWRPILAFVLLIVAIWPILFQAAPRQLLWFSAVYPFLLPWLLWGGNIWVPLLVMAGLVLGFLAFRVLDGIAGTLTGMVGAVIVVVLFWLFGVGWINGALNTLVTNSRSEGIKAELTQLTEALPPQILEHEERVAALTAELAEAEATKAEIVAQVDAANLVIDAEDASAALIGEVDALAETLSASEIDFTVLEVRAARLEDPTELLAAATSDDPLRAAHETLQSEIAPLMAAYSEAVEAAQEGAEVAPPEVDVSAALTEIADFRALLVAKVEELGPLAEEARNRRAELSDALKAHIAATLPIREEITERNGIRGRMQTRLSESAQLLAGLRNLESERAELAEIAPRADAARDALPDSVSGYDRLDALDGAEGISSEDRDALAAVLDLEQQVLALEQSIERTEAAAGLVGLTPVNSRDFGGFMLAITIGVVAIGASLPLGIVLALGRQSDLLIVKALCVGFIEFIRGVPLITLLFVASTLLNIFMPPGTNFDIILRVIIMVTLFAAAYMAEVIRGGLAALPAGQYEAADALGLDYWKAQRLIIMPQALKISIPGIVSTFIGVFKDTVLVSIIGLLDPLGLTNAIRADAAWNGVVWEIYGFIALIFFIICFSMSRYSMYLERRLKTTH